MTKIYFKSDFDLELPVFKADMYLLDNHGTFMYDTNNGTYGFLYADTPPVGLSMKAIVFTQDSILPYFASYKNGEYKNCTFSGGKFTLQIHGHKLVGGRVRVIYIISKKSGDHVMSDKRHHDSETFLKA